MWLLAYLLACVLISEQFLAKPSEQLETTNGRGPRGPS